MHPLEASSPIAGTCTLPSNTLPNASPLTRQFTVNYCQDSQKGTTWVLGHGHSVSSLLEYVRTTGNDPKAIIDQYVVNGNGDPLPAIMMEETSHSVWVNSEALRLAGMYRV